MMPLPGQAVVGLFAEAHMTLWIKAWPWRRTKMNNVDHRDYAPISSGCLLTPYCAVQLLVYLNMPETSGVT